MKEYAIYAMVSYYDTVEAESPEDAVRIFQDTCPYDIDGNTVSVYDYETDNETEVEI